MGFLLNWEYILWFSLIIVCIAYLIDFAMHKEHKAELSKNLQQQMSSEVFSFSSTIVFTNIVFCNVFDNIYGRSSVSMKRIVLSSAFSLLFVAFMVLLFGYRKTIFGSDITTDVMVVFVMTNLFADFISLTETRWVLEKARGKRVYALGLWLIVDILLTTLIYFIVFYLALLGYFTLQDLELGPTFMDALVIPYEEPGEFILLLLSVEVALPFFVSTYGTSVVWFFFAASAVVIRILSGSPRVFRLLIGAVGVSEAPARIVGVIMIILVLAGSAIAEVAHQLSEAVAKWG